MPKGVEVQVLSWAPYKKTGFCQFFYMVRGLEDLASYLFEFTKKVATRCTEHVMFKSSPGHHIKRLASASFFIWSEDLKIPGIFF